MIVTLFVLAIMALVSWTIWIVYDHFATRQRINRDVKKFAAWLDTVQPHHFDKDASR